jgi:hypothetical protein
VALEDKALLNPPYHTVHEERGITDQNIAQAIGLSEHPLFHCRAQMQQRTTSAF